MSKIYIKLSRLVNEDAIRFSSSIKQITYIQSLMEKKGMTSLFNNYFQFNNNNITNTITMKEASRLIDALIKNKEINFTKKLYIPILKEIKTKNKNLVLPQVKTKVDSIQKISYEEMQTKLNNLNVNSYEK